MKEIVVARRYAKAFIAAYKDSADFERTSQELMAMAALYKENRDLRNVILNPAVSASVKEEILLDVMKKSNFGKNTEAVVTLLLQSGRVQILPEVAEEFEHMVFNVLGRVRVEVTSAVELTGKDKTAIAEKIKETTGFDAVMDTKVDSSLIGGVVTKIGSNVMDGSVKSQLKALRVGI